MIWHALESIGDLTNHFNEHRSGTPKLTDKNILKTLNLYHLEIIDFKECLQ